LYTKQPSFYCIFFKAGWNPQCEEAETGFKEIAMIKTLELKDFSV